MTRTKLKGSREATRERRERLFVANLLAQLRLLRAEKPSKRISDSSLLESAKNSCSSQLPYAS
jgi:hypothetical protein